MRLKISRVRSWGQLLLQEAMELFHPKHLGEVSGRFLQPKQVALFFDLAQVLISYPNVPLRGAFGDPCLLVAFVTFRHVTVPRSVPAFAQSSVGYRAHVEPTRLNSAKNLPYPFGKTNGHFGKIHTPHGARRSAAESGQRLRG